MTHLVSANYTMPTILNALQPAAASGPQTILNQKAKAQATSSTSSTSTSTGGNLGVTFLNLLAQELRNQDPTAPVDSTAMVGQMISLNQLDQLIGINQVLSSAATTTPTTSAQSAAAVSDSVLGPLAGVSGTLSPSAAGAATTQLPFDPNTMMPYGSANAGAVAASINQSLNAATMGYSGTNNNTSGGK